MAVTSTRQPGKRTSYPLVVLVAGAAEAGAAADVACSGEGAACSRTLAASCMAESI